MRVRLGARAVPSIVAMVLAVAAPAGCKQPDRSPAPKKHEPAPVESVARAVGADAAAVIREVDPVAPSGDLREEVESFRTVAACAEQRRNVDPLVGDALHSIGYETFLLDACRILGALKSNDAHACEPIEASSLRERCVASLAMVAGTPDTCPFLVPAAPSRGREPTCVAVAARDARLCAGEERARRALCQALVARDASLCRAASSQPDRQACEREVTRWRSSLPESPTSAAPFAVSGTMEVKGDRPGDPAVGTSDLRDEVERGVVVSRELRGLRVRIGSLEEVGAVPHVLSPVERPHLGLDVLVPEKVGEAVLDRCEIELPGAPPVPLEVSRRALKLTVTSLSGTRGGAVALSLEGTLTPVGRSYQVIVQVKTFVRDVTATGARR